MKFEPSDVGGRRHAWIPAGNLSVEQLGKVLEQLKTEKDGDSILEAVCKDRGGNQDQIVCVSISGLCQNKVLLTVGLC